MSPAIRQDIERIESWQRWLYGYP